MTMTPETNTVREQVMSGDHAKKQTAAERHHAAGAPMRRAYVAAWCVFVGMAVTSMTFQTFHAITVGQMAWPLAALYGIAPLAISIGVLEFTAGWELWAKTGSYLIAGGAMYASASATGSVTEHAAAAHTELVFGLILDAAALLAIAYINHGPTAKQAVAAVARREAELVAEIADARSANARQAAEHQAAMGDLHDQMRGEMNGLSAQRNADVSALRTERDRLLSDLTSAQRELAQALTRAEALEQKQSAARNAKPCKAAAATTSPAGGDGDVSTELAAYMELRANPEMRKPRMGGALAREIGVSGATARRYREKFLNPDGSLKELSDASLTGSLTDIA